MNYLKTLSLLFILALLLAPVLASASLIPRMPNNKARLLISYDPFMFNTRDIEFYGARIIYRVSIAPVLIIEISQRSIPLLYKVNGIIHMSLDEKVRISSDTIPWGVSYIGAPNVWDTTKGQIDVNGDGKGDIEVAVIDTGVDYDHPDLDDNIAWCVATLNGQITSDCYDGNGHGTHVIGTIAAELNGEGVVGVAPEVEIYAIKALNDQGSGYISDIVTAIDLAVKGPDGVVDVDGDGVVVGDPDDDAPEVISMSLGGSSDVDELHNVIISAYNWGITIVAAAGNEGASSPSYPAAYPEVIAVGAIDSDEQVPYWSNRNPEVVAPGIDILSTYPDDSYETLSGTSMATPHVSATVALIQAARIANGLPVLPPGTEDDMDNTTIRGILHITAKDLGSSGYDYLYGYGAIQADAAVNAAIGTTGGGGGGGEGEGETQQLLQNPGFDNDASGWYFYPGDYIDNAQWLSSYNGRDGVVVMYGTLPAWSFHVDDWAFIGQYVAFPSSMTSGAIEVEYYATSEGASMTVVVGIYDTENNQWIWYDTVDATQGSWQTITVTIPSDVLSQVAGKQYLFLVGVGASDFTLWWSTDVYFYVDHAYLTVTS